MVGHYFKPDEKICIIMDCVRYDKLRELPEFTKRHPDLEIWGPLRNEIMYPDMPKAREWADEFEEGIKSYGLSNN